MVDGEGGGRGATGRDRGETGFGLVEVLVAVVVLSLGLLGVASVSAGVAVLTRDAARETARALVARELLDSIRVAGYHAAAGGDGRPVQWDREWRAAWSVTESGRGLKRVELRVWGAGGRAATVVSTLLHRRATPPGATFRAAGAAR